MGTSIERFLEEGDSIMERWWNRIGDGQFRPNHFDEFQADANKARNLFDQALHIEPNNDDALDASARWHLVLGRVKAGFANDTAKQEAAAEHMREVIRRHPDDASFRGMLAGCYQRAGKKDMAIAELQKGLEIEPGNAVLQGDLRRLQGSSKGCFVATAVYASPEAPEVVVLRAFRDRILLKSTVGTAFVSFYYRVGPVLARLVERRQYLRRPVRALVLDPIVKYLSRLVNEAPE